jgi:hypothetical protein
MTSKSATETLTATTGIKTTIGTLTTVGGTLIGAVVWCTYMYMDVQILKKNDDKKSQSIEEMSEKLASVEMDVKRIRWILDPTASKPVLVSPTRSNTAANTP